MGRWWTEKESFLWGHQIDDKDKVWLTEGKKIKKRNKIFIPYGNEWSRTKFA